EEDGSEGTWSFAEMARRSDQVANWLRGLGVGRGDRILLMLANQVELWETMLAAMKLGAVIIPATTLLVEADLRDRIESGDAGFVVARAQDADKSAALTGVTRIAVGSSPAPDGWVDYA